MEKENSAPGHLDDALEGRAPSRPKMAPALLRERVEKAALPVLILAIPLLVAPVLITKSMTADEYVHVAAGALTLSTGSFRPNCEQPPLVKLLAAWPLRLTGVVSGAADPDDPEEVGAAYRDFWYEGPVDLDRILFRARIPTIAVSIALALLIYTWARSLYGPWGGRLSLAAYVFSPTVLAHTGLVTSDLAGAAGFLLALRLFCGLCQNPTRIRLILLGGAFGLALLCKFSALILLPVGGLFLLWCAVRSRMGSEPHRLDLFRAVSRGRSRRKAVTLALALLIGSAGVVTWAGYGFEVAPLSSGAKLPRNPKLSALLLASPALRSVYRFAAEKVPVPLPSLIRGIDRARKHNRHGHPAFFLGERSRDGWWSYFPIAFVLKTSLPLLLLLAITLATWRLGKGAAPLAESLLLLAALTYLLVAMTSRINIGVRHLLPIYPILFIVIGRIATVPWMFGRVGRVLLVLLLAGHAVEALRTSPHYLSYFQPLAGGASKGYRLLVDSNLDWGQDLKGMARDLEERGQRKVWLAYFGPVDPSHYGITYDPLPPTEVSGFVAISATSLQLGFVGMRRSDEDPFGWLKQYEPFDHVGHSILYFLIPEK